MSILLEIALKGLGLVLLGGLVAGLIRRSSAARHRVWVLTFVALAALPLLAVRLPEIRVERPVSVSHPVTTVTQTPTPALQKPTRPSRSLAGSNPYPTPEPPQSSSLPWLLAFAWGVGATVLLGQTALQLLVVLRWSRNAEDVADTFGATPPHTRIARSPLVEVPATFGFVRPTILLPYSSAEWTEARLRTVLLHEGAHVQRGDWVWLVFSKLVSAIYWPNPLVLWALRRLRAEAELAADDAVLRAGIDAPEYAATLVDLAAGLRRPSMSVALPIVQPGGLKNRVTAILADARSRRPLRRTTAIVAMLLGATILVPYAATRLVAGPEVVRDGIIELGGGRQAEVVAITEMRGEEAISWDVHGALMARSFPIGDQDLQAFNVLKPVPKRSTARYLIVRLTDPATDGLDLLADESPAILPYIGSSPTTEDFRDALGGSYRVMRMIVPEGARTGSFRLQLPAADWRLYAYRTYQQGEERGMFNPLANLHISPQMPALGKGTEATFVLPPEFAERESMVRFLPGGPGEARFEKMSGPLSASTNQPPDVVDRVEILSRPLRSVVLADLPVEPDLKAVHVPHHYLPEGIIEADGKSVAIEGVSSPADHPRQFWDASGRPIVGEPVNKWAEDRDRLVPLGYGQRLVRVWLARHPDGGGDPRTLYDGEGWPLFHSYISAFYPGREVREFSAGLDRSVRKLDLVAPIADSPYRTVMRLDSGSKGTTWAFSERADWTGCLRVTYPPETAAQETGVETVIRALDAKGNPVTRPEGGRAYSHSPGWVEFDLPRAAAARVKTVDIRVRPYTWVRFQDVAMTPSR